MARNCCRIAAVVAGLALLAGCGLSRPDPAKSYFAFGVAAPAPDDAGPREGVLRVARARVAPPFNDAAFHYLVGPNQYRSDYYVNFVAPPDRLITGELIAWLEASGPFAHAVGGASTVGTSATLDCAVTALYADYREPSAPTAVVAVSAFLLDESGIDATVILQRDYAETEPIAGKGPAAIVDAWNGALGRIFARIEADLRGVRGGSEQED